VTQFHLEICAANLASALTAQRAGAHRIELCSGLEAGGLTPSAGLVRAAVSALSIPVHVLIRPREGDFCYSPEEVEVMCDDIRLCRDFGAAGVVIGALDERGELDTAAMTAMLRAAEGLHVTCHRAFDSVPDPVAALEQLIAWGLGRVLSSGQATTAHEGRFLLKKLVAQSSGRIAVMPGAGISPKNIGEVRAVTGASDFHMTGRRKVTRSLPGQEITGLAWEYWESDEGKIRETMGNLSLSKN
jgi:copper homeostasis protein